MPIIIEAEDPKIVVEITDDSNEGHGAAYTQNREPEKAGRLERD